MNNLNLIFFFAWLTAGIILAVVEIFTPGTFYFLVLGAAAVGAAFFCLIPFLPWWASFIVFAILALIGTFMAKRFADRITRGPNTPTNVDRYIGKRAFVIETIDPEENKGRVRVEQDEWRALADDRVEKGTWVLVDRVEGTCLKIKKES